MKLLYESDWLASRPLFYHEITGRYGHNINDVIDWSECELDPAGFNDYLDYGYSVFGHTPVRHVKFLRHSARLWMDADGGLSVELLPDPIDGWLDKSADAEDVVELLQSRVRAWEKSVSGDIVVPTSGGLDSRLLNVLVEDKTRIRSFTYGLSRNQAESGEVVRARLLSERLRTKWEHVPIGDFNRLIDSWESAFGVSTHAHGMYQMEFFSRVATKVPSGSPLLSGIIGDAWAGSVEIPPLAGPADVVHLGYSHGMHADSGRSRLTRPTCLAEEYFCTHVRRLADPRIRVVEAMRFKIMLLSYLFRVPEVYGFIPWSPFLDIDVAMSMLNLPQECRNNRKWQRDMFKRQKLDFEGMGLKEDWENSLNREACRRTPLSPLNRELLAMVVDGDYIDWINTNVRRVGNGWDVVWRQACRQPRVMGRPLELLGLNDQWHRAYHAYLTMVPIERFMRRTMRHGGTRQQVKGRRSLGTVQGARG